MAFMTDTEMNEPESTLNGFEKCSTNINENPVTGFSAEGESGELLGTVKLRGNSSDGKVEFMSVVFPTVMRKNVVLKTTGG